MKNLFIILCLSLSLNFWAQDAQSIKFIKSQSNLNELEQLKDKFLSNYLADSIKIADFLNSNSSFKKRFSVNEVTYEIYSIVDGRPVYRTTDNINSAKATKTNSLHTGGDLGLNLNGNGMLIGVWDGGSALKTHVEFQSGDNSRITTPDTALPNPPTDGHATHVVGTIGASGVSPAAKGMAPESSIASYNWSNDLNEVTTEISSNGLLLSNHSYGVPVLNDEGNLNVGAWVMGCYNSEAVEWDELAYNSPFYLMVTSAGNSGGDSYSGGLMNGFDKLTMEKNAKNNLVVANANPFVSPVNGALINVVINSSSSQGPSDDGRIKPDIAGDGTSVLSTSDGSTTSYATLSGTSMASPNVAGSLLLLQEYYNLLHDTYMRAATLKGLVCHNAFDALPVGPDAKFGWGLLDTKESAITLTGASQTTPIAVVDELTLTQDQVYSFDVVVTDPKKLKATISWTDVPGTPKNNQLNSPTPALVNDLDLRIIKNGETNFPWKLQLSDVSAPAIKGDNVVDNVEKVEVDNASGTYTIQVTHKGNLVNTSQAYSIIVTGFDALLLSNPEFERSSVSFYPNPVNDFLYVNSSKHNVLKYELYDLQGRLIQNVNLTNQNNFEINMSSLNQGIYILNLVSEYGTITEKVIKK